MEQSGQLTQKQVQASKDGRCDDAASKPTDRNFHDHNQCFHTVSIARPAVSVGCTNG